MSQKPSLSNANSPIFLSSWPIIKYSHSVSSLSSSTQPPWTHFAHRDNIFLVIDTQRIPGYIQNDGKFSDQQTRLKVVWGLETLESLDLTSLAQQITPARDLQQQNKPAFIALGRSPSLAIRYFRADDQTRAYGPQIRRFQIKLPSDTAYQSVTTLFERANCPVEAPPISRDETRYDLSSQTQIRPQFSQFSHVQVQHTPPGTSSGYSNTSSTSSSTLSGEPHSSNNTSSYLKNIQPMKNYRNLAASNIAMSTLSTSRDLCEPSRVPQVPSHLNFSYSYLPEMTVSPNEFLEDLPPPRPPLGFESRKILDSPSACGSEPSAISSLSNLPPLPKPTPISKPPPAARVLSIAPSFDKNRSKYHESRFASSNSEFGVDTFHQGGDPPLAPKKRAGAYHPGLPGIAEEYTRSNSSNDRGSFPVFPNGYKKSKPESRTQSSPSTMQGDVSTDTADTENTNAGGKRKQHDGEKEDQEQQKKQKGAPIGGQNPRAREEEEFRQIEDFIVNAIHDDDFLKLLERIGGVWQRMGFSEVGQSFFGASVED